MMTPLQEGIQPRISRIDTNFLSGTGKAIREIRGKEGFLQQVNGDSTAKRQISHGLDGFHGLLHRQNLCNPMNPWQRLVFAVESMVNGDLRIQNG